MSAILSQWPSLLERVVPLLLAYALMPPAADLTAAASGDGSRVRETKKALLGRSNGGGGGRSRSSASRSSPSAAAPVVAKGTVSKITEKFQAQPCAPPPPRTCTRVPCKPSVGRSALPPPPLPPLPPPVIKHDIKRRQEKLLSELHRRRGRDDRTKSVSCSRLPAVGGAGAGGGDSAVSSDCGSSSDSEKSVCCGGGELVETSVAAVVDKPGSPHSSGYESVEETVVVAVDDFVAAAAIPYSWVFGAGEHDGRFDANPSSSSTSSASSSCGDDVVTAVAPEDRLERLVTFSSVASCPALTRAKPDQDVDDDLPVVVRRHFVGNDVAMTTGYLSPIPEGSSTEPNSVETVDDCYGDDKVYTHRPNRPKKFSAHNYLCRSKSKKVKKSFLKFHRFFLIKW